MCVENLASTGIQCVMVDSGILMLNLPMLFIKVAVVCISECLYTSEGSI